MSVSFEFLPKDRTAEYMPGLFDILHSNMSVIAPTGNSYEEDFRIWSAAVGEGLKRDARQIILIRDGGTIIGFFQYYINDSVFMMEEIQFRREYQGKGVFRRLYGFLRGVVPETVESVEAYARKENAKSQAILGHLGLKIIGEGSGGRTYHYRGDCQAMLNRYGGESK